MVRVIAWDQHSVGVLNQKAAEVIAERRAAGVDDDAVDVLSLFLRKRDDDGQPFDDAYLRDLIMNFMIAGRDTTAVLMSWATFSLTTHPVRRWGDGVCLVRVALRCVALCWHRT